MGFLESILDSVEETESPTRYWVWSGLAAISACAKNVRLSRGRAYFLYPNIYVLLIGESAIRKGPPVNLAQDLVESVNCTRVISGRNTIQSIIAEIGKARTLETGGILSDSSAFIVSDESSNVIMDDPQGQSILTQLYDSGYHKTWKNSTLGGGQIQLQKPYIVMLGATAPSHIPEMIQQRSIEGGFIGRTMLVEAKHRARLNSLMDDIKNPIDQEKLVKRLKEIALLKGDFQIESAAKKGYNSWYQEYNQRLDRGEIIDKTGTAGRMGDHVLKIAMLLSLSEKDELFITEDNIEDATEYCTAFTTTANKVTLGTRGKSETGIKVQLVVLELLKMDDLSLTRPKLLQKLYPDIDAYELDRTIETLKQGKMIDEVKEGKDVKYTLRKNIAEYFKSAIEVKKKKMEGK